MENEYVITSNDKRKFIFKFKIENEENLIITAKEENFGKIIPETYQKEFTKDELSNREKSQMSFDNFDAIFQHIKLSFENGTATLNVDSSGIVLSYLLFNKLKVDLLIPPYNSVSTENFDNFCLYLSQSKSLQSRYQKMIKKFMTFFKQITNQGNNFYKKAFSDLQNEIDNKFKEFSRTQINAIDQIKRLITGNSLSKSKKQINSTQSFSRIKVVQTIEDHHTGGINSICILKDKRLASGSNDKSIIVYNHSYQPQIHITNAHDRGIWSLYVLKNGNLASSSSDRTIKIWRIDDSDFELIQTLKGHNNWIFKVIELKDGKMASCSADSTIKIWDDNHQCVETLEGHKGIVSSILEMNNYIISVSNDNTLRIWDQSKWEAIKIISDVPYDSIDGLAKMNKDTILVGTRNKLHLVDIGTFNVNEIEDESLGWVYCLNVSKDGKVLFGNDKGEIICYDPSFRQVLFKKKFHKGFVFCLRETEDNQLISSSEDKTIKIYKKEESKQTPHI